MSEYEIWVNTPTYGSRTAIISGSGSGYVFISLRYTRTENQVTELSLTMPYVSGLVELFPLDTRFEVYRDGVLQAETQWFVRVPPKLIYDDSGRLLVEVRAVCALYLLEGRIVAYAAGSSQSEKTGAADDLIKAVARENLGTLATADRNLSSHLDVQANSSQGATVYKTMPRRNVLLVCQELARASAQAGKPIFFDVVWTSTKLELRTYLDKRGSDHQSTSLSPVVLSPEFGNLTDASRSFDHRDEVSVVYCAGQGTGNDRVIVSVADAARRDATPFNRREVFVDARYLSLTSSLATEADGMLWRRRPVQQLRGTVVSTPQCVYGTHWGFGDLLSAEFDGEILTVRVHSVTVDVAGGFERISVDLRADSMDADDPVRRIEGLIDGQAPDELPIFSETPLDHAVPRAPSGATTIADGWLSAAIARLVDLTWGNITGKPTSFTPSAHTHTIADLPVAASGTSNTTQLVRADDSRLSNSRTPTAHAATHQHAGVDEIATATPGANAIPKAGSVGTIADGWLSSAIGRITGINFVAPSGIFGVSGVPLTSGSGTINLTFTPQQARKVLAGPLTGADATPTFRSLSALDMPAHAAYHQHGGFDEVSTATPGANAIPKAGSGGTIADGWLSAAIARLPVALASQVSGVLPVANGGTGVSVMPAFSVHKNGVHQAGFTYGTFVKVTWPTEVFDNNNNFASDRFTPTVAGKYLLASALRFPVNVSGGELIVSIVKNGLEVARASVPLLSSGSYQPYQPFVSYVVSMNGSTDYVEIYGYQSFSASSQTLEGYSYTTFWSGTWVAP